MPTSNPKSNKKAGEKRQKRETSTSHKNKSMRLMDPEKPMNLENDAPRDVINEPNIIDDNNMDIPEVMDVEPLENNDAPPVENNNALPVENNDAPPVENNDALPVENNDAPPVENNDALPVENNDDEPRENNDAPPVENNDDEPRENNDAPPVENNDAPPVENNDAPPEKNNDAPLENPMNLENDALRGIIIQPNINENIPEAMDAPPVENNDAPHEENNVAPFEENNLPFEENIAEFEDNIAKPKENNVPIEEMDDEAEKEPIEPFDTKFQEFYLNTGYCRRNDGRDQYYAKNDAGNEIYYTDSNGNELYAAKTIQVGDSTQTIEYPATLSTGKQNFIYVEGIPKYPENHDTAEIILPKNPNTGEEYYLPNEDGTITYPRNQYGMGFYRKDAEGNEIPISDHKYATNIDGTEIYPRWKNGDEYYLKAEYGNSEIGAIRILKDESMSYYARKNNDDEFYPRLYI